MYLTQLYSLVSALLVLSLLPAFSGLWAQQNPAGILSDAENIKITRLDQLNTRFYETNLSLSPDGKYLYYMSSRGGQSWSVPVKGLGSYIERYDGDIWYSVRGADSVWGAPRCLAAPINTNSGEDEPSISPDGQHVHFQSWKDSWSTDGGPYYTSRMRGNTWGTPTGMGGGINSFFVQEFVKHNGTYATDGMAVSPDGKLFVVAAGADYYGNMDIYYSVKDADGEWGRMRRAPISTSLNERSVFIAGDGRTIYFSTNGLGGSGGLDIYKTTFDVNTNVWTRPINMGAPFNTAGDDQGLVLSANGEEAYFIRNGDIYMANMKNAKKDLKPTLTVVIVGKVSDYDTRRALERNVSLKKPESEASLMHGKSDATSGDYSLVLNQFDMQYEIFVPETDDYEGYSQLVKVPNITESMKITVDIRLKKKTGVKPPVNEPSPKFNPKPEDDLGAERTATVYFEPDSARISPKYASKLKSILKEAAIFQKGEVEIIGFTDESGLRSFNFKLGKKRAESVRDFLLANGLNPNWPVTLRSLGETNLRTDKTADTNRNDNRRVEVILKRMK